MCTLLAGREEVTENSTFVNALDKADNSGWPLRTLINNFKSTLASENPSRLDWMKINC